MKRRIALLVILVLSIACFIWWKVASRPTPPEIPAIEVDHLHPLIAEAIQKAVSRVESSPRSASAWGELGMLLMAHDNPAAARRCFQQAERLDPDNFRWPYFQGCSLANDDFEAALAMYQRAMKLQTNYIPLRLRTARTLFRLGRLEECRSLLEETRRINSNAPYVLLMSGRLAVAEGDSSHAEEFFRQAAKHSGWPRQSAYRELVKLTARQGDIEHAYNYQRELALLDPVERVDDPDPELAAVYSRFEALSKGQAKRADLALTRGDLSVAITEYESFLKKRTDLPTAYTNLAQAYALSNRYEEAIATYQKALNRFDDNIAARLGLASTYQMVGKPELAIEQIRAALRLKPDNQQAWFRLGVLHERQERLEDAIVCYQRSSAVDPSFAPAELALGTAYLKQNRITLAKKHIERAVELAPNDPIPLGFLNKVEARLKATKTAPGRRMP